MMFASICAIATALCLAQDPVASADPLSSWNDGPSKRSILAFVEEVTTQGREGFVAPSRRIAVFDNDGTLWAEQPIYVQLAFAMDRVRALAPQHPEWKEQEPFRSILAGDQNAALAGGESAIAKIIAETHSGLTTDEFEEIVMSWAKSAQHPRFQRPYIRCVYQPMLELLAFLRSKGFKTFIVSGGGIDFMRPWTEGVYGIPPEQVIGSSGKTKWEMKDGVPVLVKLPEIWSVDDKAGKPQHIHLHIGRRPIAAFGNSDGDLEMLQWTAAAGDAKRLCLIVHHTDAEREWAYDRTSQVGKLDRALDEARQRGWVVVDMKAEWKTIFPGS